MKYIISIIAILITMSICTLLLLDSNYKVEKAITDTKEENNISHTYIYQEVPVIQEKSVVIEEQPEEKEIDSEEKIIEENTNVDIYYPKEKEYKYEENNISNSIQIEEPKETEPSPVQTSSNEIILEGKTELPEYDNYRVGDEVTCEHCSQIGYYYKNIIEWTDTKGNCHLTHYKTCTNAFREQNNISSSTDFTCP